MTNEVTTTRQDDAYLTAIERAMINPNVDIDKLERLFELQRQWQDRQAVQLFALAMSEAQGEIGRITANKPNVATRSRYADLAQLDRELRPIYTAHGFALSFGTSGATAGAFDVVCDVMHRGGHIKRYSIPMPADGRGARGGDVMTKTHATGSAMTYGRRYLTAAIFNVAIGDDDGNAATVQPPDEGATQSRSDRVFDRAQTARGARKGGPRNDDTAPAPKTPQNRPQGGTEGGPDATHTPDSTVDDVSGAIEGDAGIDIDEKEALTDEASDLMGRFAICSTAEYDALVIEGSQLAAALTEAGLAHVVSTLRQAATNAKHRLDQMEG